MSRKFVFSSDISAVNFMVGWCLFASKMNWSISSLFVSRHVIDVSFRLEGFYLAFIDVSLWINGKG